MTNAIRPATKAVAANPATAMANTTPSARACGPDPSRPAALQAPREPDHARTSIPSRSEGLLPLVGPGSALAEG
jgi:hypothetical protein